jgi:thiol-disulfide isomerase/thioredoxin
MSLITVSRRLLSPLALIAAVLAPRDISAQESGIAVGSTGPDAVLETLDGRPARLSQWVGKVPVVLEFWASWCSNCRALEPEIARMAQQHGRAVKFVGVAVSVNQTPDRVRRHLQRHALPLEMLYDRSGTATDAYEVPATSYVVVLDRRGRVVYTGSGGGQTLSAALQRAIVAN